MDFASSLSNLVDGFGTALTPANLLFAAVGVVGGTAIGVLPGIGPAMAVALLLPVTYGLEPTGAFIMFAGIYYGGMFGGSTTSILLNTPGESASVVAAIEGYPMAKRGRAPQALAASAIGNFVGGLIGTIALVLLAPIVASLAVGIGAPDYFAVMVLAFVAVTSVLGRSRIRGFASLLVGLTIGLIGLDQMTGQARLTFGSLHLTDGVDVVVVAVGLFAVGEALWVARAPAEQTRTAAAGRTAVARCRRPPPHLEAVAARPGDRFPVRGHPSRWCRDPDLLVLHHREAVVEAQGRVRQRGHRRGGGSGVHGQRLGGGNHDDHAHARPADHGGHRGDAGRVPAVRHPTRAVAVRTRGRPGLGALASLFVGLVLLLVINLPMAPLWAKLLHIPRPYLYAGILFFASVGAYAVGGQVLDLLLLFAIGVIGFTMRRFGLPVLPAVIGVILGPAAELQMRRALQISNGDLTGLVNSPMAAVVYVIVALILLWPVLRGVVRSRRRAKTPTG